MLILLGLAGAILPIPGPPFSFAGLLCLHFTQPISFEINWLAVLGILTVLIVALDFYSPVWFTKRFGGTKYGSWGAILGLIIGLFTLGPFFVIGPFIGAFAGEMLSGVSAQNAFRPALGSFIGFLFGLMLKFGLAAVMAVIGFRAIYFAVF